MKSVKNINNIIVAIVSIVAVVTTIVVFHKQITSALTRAKNFIETKIKRLKTPSEYEDFADI